MSNQKVTQNLEFARSSVLMIPVTVPGSPRRELAQRKYAEKINERLNV